MTDWCTQIVVDAEAGLLLPVIPGMSVSFKDCASLQNHKLTYIHVYIVKRHTHCYGD